MEEGADPTPQGLRSSPGGGQDPGEDEPLPPSRWTTRRGSLSETLKSRAREYESMERPVNERIIAATERALSQSGPSPLSKLPRGQSGLQFEPTPGTNALSASSQAQGSRGPSGASSPIGSFRVAKGRRASLLEEAAAGAAG
eukprot:CAMPEP_0174924074 /NCGR_PEP_ID=MMETSP1355-20121228/7004_1 /TAXON_ID=464990 /ORGANISM="Hemiselmis tepida, Strain CCMP443" /LENGTH=141 /DNA_ID=CAMNT_0016169825 /DNA_START=73 /DNA_END=495 /DNA_ORIENTATION=-